MNHFKVLFGVLLVFALMALPASATTIVEVNSGSEGVNEWITVPSMAGNQPVVVVTPHPAWDASLLPDTQWVSYTNSGYNGQVLPNTTVGGMPTFTYYVQFYLPYEVNSGTVTLGADDTADLWLNGVQIYAANPVQDNACADGPVACEPGEFITLNIAGMAMGWNYIHSNVFQIAGGPTSVTLEATVESSPVPEPTTFALMGIGLLALGGTFHRRRQQNNQ